MATIEEFETRLRALEAAEVHRDDLEKIKILKADYALACDDMYNPKTMEKFFTDDAIWDGGPHFGRYEGKDDIINFFEGVSENIVYALHYILMPKITVEGEMAKGSWYLWMVATMNKTGGVFGAGVYSDRYQKVNDKWLFKEVTLDLQMFTQYEDGWHKQPFSGVA